MTFLPIDYYILLQENFEHKSEISKTNYVMFHDMPLLQKKRTYFDSNIVKNVTYEDIYRCIEKEEAESLLLD